MTGPRPFSWLQSAIAAGVINAALNGALGWFLLRDGMRLPLWGVPGLGADVLAMAFGISFGTGLVVTPLTRAELRAGKTLPPPLGARWREAFQRWPSSTFMRALNLGVLSVLLFAPVPLLLLWALEVDGTDRSGLALFKAGFGFVQGALVTPPIAVAAMVTGPVERAPT